MRSVRVDLSALLFSQSHNSPTLLIFILFFSLRSVDFLFLVTNAIPRASSLSYVSSISRFSESLNSGRQSTRHVAHTCAPRSVELVPFDRFHDFLHLELDKTRPVQRSASPPPSPLAAPPPPSPLLLCLYPLPPPTLDRRCSLLPHSADERPSTSLLARNYRFIHSRHAVAVGLSARRPPSVESSLTRDSCQTDNSSDFLCDKISFYEIIRINCFNFFLI